MHAHDDAGVARGGHGHSHPDLSAAAGALVRLSPNLYWFRDTCNVYLLVRGDRGSSHRLRLGGDPRPSRRGGRARDRVGAPHPPPPRPVPGRPPPRGAGRPDRGPEREAALFAETDAFWRLKRVYDNYDVSSIGYTLPRPVPVARRLSDYETFDWRGHDIQVLPTPGHTKGSVTFAVEVDGLPRAFSGDLDRRARARPHDPRPPVAVRHARRGRRSAPLRPRSSPGCRSSGSRPRTATRSTRRRRSRRSRRTSATCTSLQGEVRQNRVWLLWPHAVDQPKTQVLPHLWANPHSLANIYALVADDGRALLLDYGFPAGTTSPRTCASSSTRSPI